MQAPQAEGSGNRAEVLRRSAYAPVSAQEEFIVPLLKCGIEIQLSNVIGRDCPAGKALDVGCGRQPFRQQIEESGASYYSLDVSAQPGMQIDFIAAIDQPLPEALYEAGPFDAIVCSEVLEHVADWNEAFGNFARLSAVGGHVLLTSPHFFPLHEEPYDFWRPTSYAIRHFAARFGFAVEHEERLGTGWDVLGTLLARQLYAPAKSGRVLRLASRVLTALRLLALKLLTMRAIQRAFVDNGPYYLANLHVLRKVAD